MHETLKLKDLSYEAMCAIIAQVIQAANRQYNEAIGGMPVNLTWEQLLEEQRQRLIKAVSETIINPKTPERQHDAWCEAKKAEGYTLDERVDHIRKTHPSLVRFNELPFEEQLKDALFLGITSIFASALDLGEPFAEPVLHQPAGEGDGELIDEIDEYTDGPVGVDTDGCSGTIGDAVEAAQEKLDNIPEDQDPEIDSEPARTPDGASISGYDPDNPPPEEVEETFEKGREEPKFPLPPPQELFDKQGDDKLAVTPENVLDPDDLQNPDYVPDEHPKGKVVEPTQAQGPKPNLPDEDLDPVDHKATKEKQDTPAKRAKKAKKK